MICSSRQHGMAVKALLILNGTEEGGTYIDTTVNSHDRNTSAHARSREKDLARAVLKFQLAGISLLYGATDALSRSGLV